MSLANNVEFLRRLPKLNGINALGDFGRNLRPGFRSPPDRNRGFRFQSGRSQDAVLCPGPSLQEPRALVVVLHGCGQTAAGYDLGAGWSTLAKRYGFALLMPEQQPSNNANGCFNWFNPEDIAREQRRSLFDPADDRAHGRAITKSTSVASSSPGFPPAAP